MDEPTNALDEEGVELIRGLVREEQERGATVLVSSHNREDIEQLCDTVTVLENGRVKEARPA